MKNVKSPEDALGFKVYLLRIYPYNKLFLYYIHIEEKLEEELALFELKKKLQISSRLFNSSRNPEC